MNLLLISVDSLRFDFVSRTNPQIHTPYFDALSRSFCFSDRCFSVSSATRPVHTSLFTGRYPCEHGVTSQRSPAMRPGIPHLFALLTARGYAMSAFSEAAGIFTGLDFAPWIGDLNRERVLRFVGARGQKALFVHLWGCHTPYGAPDGRAMGDTARQLREGGRSQVILRYQRAVEQVFETQVAPLLDHLDLQEWMVLICGDHGESWTAEEPYHGQTLNNSVLRVPLYLHVPHSGNPLLAGPLFSLVDVFPTLDALLALESGYEGYGRDLRREERPALYLAQIQPGGTLEDGRPGGDCTIPGAVAGGAQWALFDAHRKFTYWEEKGVSRLERTFGGEELPCGDAEVQSYRSVFAAMVANSPYAQIPDPSGKTEIQLDRRLRDLGYL